jgi:hypothetical protein
MWGDNVSLVRAAVPTAVTNPTWRGLVQMARAPERRAAKWLLHSERGRANRRPLAEKPGGAVV